MACRKQQRRSQFVLKAATLAAATLSAASMTSAATLTWNGGGADDLWTTAANWAGVVSPSAGDLLTFGGVTRLTPSNDTAAGKTYLGLTFNSGAGAFVLGGNAIVVGTPIDNGTGTTLGGGFINSNASGATAETVDMNLTLAAGRHDFTTSAASGALNFGTVGTPITITRSSGTTAVFTKTGGNINFSNATGLANDASNGGGILGAWATIGNEWATLDGSKNIIAYGGYTAITTGAIPVASSTVNFKYGATSTGNLTAATGTIVNTILDAHTDANNRTLTVTGTMKFGGAGSGTNGGGVFRSSAGANGFTVTGGTITANGGGELTLSDASFTATANNLTVNSIIANDGANAVSVNVMGYVVMNAVNTFTGGTIIAQGRVQASNLSSFGASGSTVTVNPGGQAFLNAAGTWNNFFVLNGVGSTESGGLGAIRMGSGRTLAGPTAGPNTGVAIYLAGNSSLGVSTSSTITGKITGPGGLTFGSGTTNNGNGQFNVGGAVANDYQGDTRIGSNNSAAAANKLFINAGANNIMPHGAGMGNVILNANSATISATFDLDDTTQTINGLSSTATSPANNIVTTGVGATLSVGDNNATATFGGVIQGPINLTKIGGGTQGLSGANTYTGATTVSGGTLSVTSTGSLAAGSAVTVNTGGTLTVSGSVGGTVSNSGTLGGNGTVSGDVTVNNAGTVTGGIAGNGTLTLNGNVTVGTAGTDTAVMNVTPNTTSPTTGSIVVGPAGTLTLNGAANSVTVNVGGAAPALGSYVLIDYSNIGGSGFSAFTLGTLPNRVLANLVDNVGNTSVDLNVTGVDFPKWTGKASAEWSTNIIGAPKNWVLNSDGVTTTDYLEGDSVLFNDSATGTTNVNISVADVSPSAITVNNSILNYTIGGSKSIIGTGALTKSGTKTLTINTANTFGGGTTLNAGTLNIGNAAALGSGPIRINGGTIDNTSGAAITFASNPSQTWGGSFTFIGSNNLNMGSGAVTLNANPTITVSAGSLTVGGIIANGIGSSITKDGPGTLVLGGASTYTGPFTINAGTVAITNSNALGAVASVADVNVNSGGAIDLGQAATGAINLGDKNIKVAGSGPAGLGALYNSGQNTQLNAFNFVTLTADAKVGGYRMDVGRVPAPAANGVIDLATHTLTVAMSSNGVVTGPQPLFSVLDKVTVIGNGSIDVTSGCLGLEVGCSVTAANVTGVTFETGSLLQLFRLNPTSVTTPMTFMGNNIIGGGSNTGTVPQLDSPITIKGPLTFMPLASGNPNPGAANPLIIAGVIGESGGPQSVTKTGAGTTTLTQLNTYSGVTTLNGGILSVSSLDNGGNPSGIGQSGPAASNLVLSGGTLQYTGGGATIDRQFTITSAGGALDSSGGGGALVFSDVNAIPNTDAAARNGSLTNGNTTVNGLSNVGDLVVGMTVSGADVPGGTTITAINAGTNSITLSAAPTASASESLSFSVVARALTLTGANTANNTLNASLTNSTGGGVTSLTKSGAGLWVVTGTNTYTGATNLGGGTLRMGAAAGIPSGTVLNFLAANSTLDLQANSLTVSSATFADAASTTFNGAITGSATLTVSGGDFHMGGANFTAAVVNLDLSGLTNFVYNSAADHFRIGGRSQLATGNLGGDGTLTMATNNTITALELGVSDGNLASTTANGQNKGTIHLGQTNTINVNTIDLAGGTSGVGGGVVKAIGTIDFRSISSPTVTIRGTAGGSSRANLFMGRQNTGAATAVASTGTFDVTLGTIDAMFGTVALGTIANGSASATQGATGVFKMAAGTVDATSITLGLDQGGTGAAVAAGTWDMTGGSVAVTTLTIADDTVAGGASATGTFNLHNGTLTATTIAKGANTGIANLNWDAGTIQNTPGGNLTVSGAMFINLNAIGTHTVNVSGANTATIGAGVGLTGAGSLAKSGSGSLTINTSPTYTGSTDVSAGKLVLNTNLTTSSAVNVTGGSVELPSNGTNQRIIKTSSVSVSAGHINLSDNKMIVVGGATGSTWNGAAYDGVAGLVASGYNGGTNDGVGIVTDQPNAISPNVLTQLVSISADDSGLAGGVFGGQSVNSGDQLIMYTWGGDANLDGTLNGDDYFQIDSHFNQDGLVFGYFNGDFNYDGAINGDDYFIIDSNFNAGSTGTPFPVSAGAGGPTLAGVTAVPEPASLGMLAIAASGLAARRRRAVR